MSKIIKFKAKLSVIIKFKAHRLYLEYMKATKPGNNFIIKESEYAYKVRQVSCLFYAHTIYEEIGDQKDYLKIVKMEMPDTVKWIKYTIREAIKTGGVDKLYAYLMEKLHE